MIRFETLYMKLKCFLDGDKRFFLFLHQAGSDSSSSSSDRYFYEKVTGHCVFPAALHQNHCRFSCFFLVLGILWFLMDSLCQRSILETILVLVVCLHTIALCPRFCCTLQHLRYLLKGPGLCLYAVPAIVWFSLSLPALKPDCVMIYLVCHVCLPLTVFSKHFT